MKKFYNFLGAAILLLTLFSFPIGMRGQTRDTQTVSYGWETTDDATPWTISEAIVATSGQGNTGTYAGKINTNSTTVQFNEKVYVTSFSYAFKRTSNNNNYSVYIETSTDGSTWSIKDTQAMNTFSNGSYRTVTKEFDGTEEVYVRFRCNNTTAVRYVDDVTITYATSASQLDPCDLALTNASTSLVFDIYDDANAKVINYTTSSTGAVTVVESEYVETVVDQTNKTITVTPLAVTNGAKVITVNQAADDNYAAGSKTFTINITDSTPFTGGDVTFDAKVDKDPNNTAQGAGSITKNGIIFECDNGILGNGSEYRLYKNSVTTFSVSEGTITQIAFTCNSSTYPASGFANQTGWSTNGNNGTWTGSAQTVSFTASGSQVRATLIVVTVDLSSSDAPSISADNVNLTYNATSGLIEGEIENYVEGTISASTEASWISDFTYDQADEFFEIGFTTTANTSASERTATVVLTYTYGNQTVTKNVIVTQAGDPNAPGTVNNPYTVAQAIAAIDANTGLTDVYATGIISQVDSYNSNYNSITYWISDDGTTTNQLEVYSGKGLNNSNFTSIEDVEIGATVVVFGTLKKYNSTYEFDRNNYLVEYTAPIHAVEAPTFSPIAGTYAEEQTVTISCETPDVDIYYTIDGTDPDDESEPYGVPITVDETTTIKAIAYDGDTPSNIATATYHICSVANPYTVTEALAFPEYQYPAQGIYVTGIVSTAPTSAPTNNGELTYFISVDGEATDQLEVYKGKGLEQAVFTAQDDIQVGDIVTVYGNVVIYGTSNPIKEFAQGNYLVSFERPEPVLEEYDLTVEPFENLEIITFVNDEMVMEEDGTTQVTEGTQVMLSIVANEGYVIETLMVNGVNHASDIADDFTYTFTMPSENVAISATAVEYVAPATENYELYSGDLIEGDYVIYYNSYALKNEQLGTTGRLAFETVTPDNGVIAADATIVWHIAPSETDGYWTLYSADAEAYAASTGAKNKAQMLADGTDDKALWSVTVIESKDNTYEFVNKYNYDHNVNHLLRNNGTNGFACYAAATGGTLSLYKKVESITETYTLSINGYENNNKGGYYLIASPVTVDPTTADGMTDGEFDLYQFNQSAASEWENWKDEATDHYHFNLVPGMGYLYAKQATTEGEVFNFTLTGTPYDGTPITLVKDENAPRFPGWNLVGNPYNETVYVGRDFYVMNSAGGEILAAEEDGIEPMQGFFVVAQTNGEILTLSTTAPANTGEKFVFNLSQGRGDVIDRAIVRFGEGQTLPKFQLFENSTKLYIPQSNDDCAVVYASEQGELPLNFKAAENGSYTLSFNNEATGYTSLHLIDNKTRADIDLLANPSYTFNAETTDDEDRFILVYSKAGAQTLPYSYGFEDNNLATDGWTAQITSTYSGINSAAAHTGSLGFRFQYSENPGYLVSPLFTGGDKGIDMSFYYKEYSSSYGNENFQVGYTTDANETDPSNFRYGEIIEASTSWQQYTETLPAGTVRMAIKYLYVDAFYLYLDDFTFEASNPCAKPTNLAVTTDGETATVTWDGTAANNFIVTVNGTPASGKTSPYTFNVALSSTYEVIVEADCGAVGTSNPESISFSTPDCLGGHVIGYALNDSFGDGWSGNAINIVDECGNVIETLTIASGSSNNGTLSLCGEFYQFTWAIGSYAYEASFTLTDNGNAIYSNQSGSSLTDGQVLYTIGTNTRIPRPTALTAGTPGYDNVDLNWTENGTATAWEICINGNESNLVPANTNVNFNLNVLQPDNSYSIKVRAVNGSDSSCWSDEVTVTTPEACAKPTSLTEANITFTTADLSWTGSANSYVAEYGIWTQAGTDCTATGTMTSYPFDLSGFSGKGTVAIRHYNVNDQFYLNVDDIVVKDANGNIVYSENFESGSIPTNMSNIDLDGDGYAWNLGSAGQLNSNGSYCVYSASWLNGTVLYPDNWLVISDITLGGSITIDARGQDASAPAENFGVYVIADNQFTQAYSGTETSCQVTGLTEGTAYAWRVQGDCGGEYPSNWVFSMFKTKDDLLIFANDGDWDNLNNWTDLDGNAATALPTVDNKVRIDADATIPAGVVATAKNATLNGGSIDIKDGGQLKQGGSVKVTMHKGITGYGAGNENDADHYYFIATPHNCSWLEENTTFPYVLNLTDGSYDLYAFDATADLEWINYENNPNHTDFHQGSNTGLFNKKGYLYANENNKDLTFIGTVSSSLNISLTESFTYDETSTNEFNGWKLVGNPYSCNAYINYVDANGDVLEADFYTLNDGKTYTLSESNVGLAPLAGALINYSATGKIQFASEEPTGGKRSGMLNMTLTQGRGKVDQARIRFGQGYNLDKISFRNNSSRLYIPQDNRDYAVVYAEAMGEMPVNFKAEQNGNYTLSFNNEEVSFTYLHLIDNLTGADVDLLANPSYSFDAKMTDYASRFKLVYTTGTTADSDNFGFISNNHLMILGLDGQATLKIMDVTGRTLSIETFSGSYDKALNLSSGVYMLQLIQGNNVKTQKIVVR